MKIIFFFIFLILSTNIAQATETEISVYNIDWQILLVNDTQTFSSLNTLYSPSWLSIWNTTTQKFEVYKTQRLYRSTQIIPSGVAVMGKFTTNKTVITTLNDSYNWNLSTGWNLVGIS